MGSEGSVGSIRSAGSGQSSEGTNGHGTGLLIENAQVGGSGCWDRAGLTLLLPIPGTLSRLLPCLQPLTSAGEDQVLPGLHPPSLAGRKGQWDLDGLGEVQMGRPRAWLPFILSPPILFLSLLEDNLGHRPLANCHSGEQLFTQDVRPEQLLEGKV